MADPARSVHHDVAVPCTGEGWLASSCTPVVHRRERIAAAASQAARPEPRRCEMHARASAVDIALQPPH